ncbi:MAG: hypothetical protein U9N85_05355 [Bacteroidota bacterium]|nr:hypothetical protein [Bacteroidota bacterium]
MKKLSLFLVLVIFTSGLSMGQAISDKVPIPIGVTLNKVSRMNITSGGSIEFVFNTIADYNSGKNSTAASDGTSLTQYQTAFNVASSSDFTVNLMAETEFTSTDDTGAGTLAVNFLEFLLENDGSYTFGVENQIPLGNEYTTGTGGAAVSVTTTGDNIIVGSGNAGDINQNSFIIHWMLGTGVNFSTLLGNAAQGRYVTNVLLTLN